MKSTCPSRCTLIGTLLIGAILPVRAVRGDSLTFEGDTDLGRYRLVSAAASLALANESGTQPRCLLQDATADFEAAALPPSPRVVRATLYVLASLLSDDGMDYPGQELFVSEGRSYAVPEDRPGLAQAAAMAADKVAVLTTPAGEFSVDAATEVRSTGFFYNEPGSAGNVAYTLSRFDITNAAGPLFLPGPYTLSELRADVCFGAESTCTDAQDTAQCDQPHPYTAAAFAIAAVVEDPAEPMRRISFYEGPLLLWQNNVDLQLSPGFRVDSRPRGAITLFSIAGNLGQPSVNAPTGPCAASEYIEVDADANPAADGLCLTDDDNPVGNLFNETGNQQAALSPPPCGGPSIGCCNGDGLCPLAFADLDRFPIDAALQADATQLVLRAGTTEDRVAIGLVAVETEADNPDLATDSRFLHIASASDAGVIGGSLDYRIALSNTGNAVARAVTVQMVLPLHVLGAHVSALPEGAVDGSNLNDDGSEGRIDVFGFDVEPGRVEEIHVAMQITCAALEKTIAPTAAIQAIGVPTFSVRAPNVSPHGPGVGDCIEFVADGTRSLRGGGCNAGAPLGLMGLFLMMTCVRRNR